MKTMLYAMQKKQMGISEDVIPIFEGILQKHNDLGAPNSGYCDKEFIEAMEKHLTKEQRFRLYAQNGGCKGTGRDKERKAFALEHADKTLAEKLELFVNMYNRKAILNDDNTIAVTFTCAHRYHKVKRDQGKSIPLPPVELYFESCAGGRLYELQKALGIKLRIKSIDISSLDENFDNPVVYAFEIVE
ncbi:MAG: hypothetical protein FWC71_11400 [Defluviitaleaceae bacterium]|nr:hypothetical protein [Defluviitaleaceae bacterium]